MIFKLVVARPHDDNLKVYYRNRLKFVLKLAKENDCLKKFEKSAGNLREQWRIVHTQIGDGQNKNDIVQIKKNEQIIKNYKDIAHEFTSFFRDALKSIRSTILFTDDHDVFYLSFKVVYYKILYFVHQQMSMK